MSKATTQNQDNRDYLERGFIRMLPVKLADAEIVERSTRFVELRDKLSELDTELALARTTYKEKAEHLENEIEKLATIIRAKAEDRPIECDAFFKDGAVHCVRHDTQEVFETRAAAPHEIQTKLDDKGLFEVAAERMSADDDGPGEDLDDLPEVVAPKKKRAKKG